MSQNDTIIALISLLPTWSKTFDKLLTQVLIFQLKFDSLPPSFHLNNLMILILEHTLLPCFKLLPFYTNLFLLLFPAITIISIFSTTLVNTLLIYIYISLPTMECSHLDHTICLALNIALKVCSLKWSLLWYICLHI